MSEDSSRAGKVEQSAGTEAAPTEAGKSGSAARRDAGAKPPQEAPPKAGEAAQPDAGKAAPPTRDAGQPARPADAGKQQDSGLPRDAGHADMPRHAGAGAGGGAGAGAAHDAAAPSASDAGLDAAAPSGRTVCPVLTTLNTYEGEPNYHGRLELKNIGNTTWMLPTISFDLPSAANVCNDPHALPGAGWTLESSAGHCKYTKTAPALSVAPNTTLLLEYSSDYDDTLAEPAVTHVSVTSCD